MREVMNFNYRWAFSKEANEIPKEYPKRWCLVNLPHTWNNIDGQDGGNDYYRGIAYYAKRFERSELPQGECYYLEFCGANASATVYLNGVCLGQHDGGYSTWRVAFTEALAESNLLVVAVDNCVNDRVYPQAADFTFYGGLYRDVNVIAVPKEHFDLEYYGGPGIAVTPTTEGNSAKVSVEVYMNDAAKECELTYCLKEADGTVISEICKPAKERCVAFCIEQVRRWDGRKDPYLYTAEVTLHRGGVELDKVTTRFGCRTFSIDPERGFLLNGREYSLRGVSRHQDRWGYGNALLPEHHFEDMELIRELGATTIRLAHYQHDQYFYDLCDAYGMVVWAEIPYISNHMPTGRENTISQMKELVIQNYNHPSIVVWGLSNEITMSGGGDDLLENHHLLNAMVHEMDKTRLTTLAAVSMCDIHEPYLQIPDAVSYNHYFGWYGGETSMNGPWFDHFHETFPKRPIGVSEYGCEALNWHTSEPKQGDYTEEYQAYYHEELIKQLFTRKYLWATYVWNMFDFGADARNEGGEDGQNHKGLVTFDRKYKKDAFYAYKAWLSDEPFVHICGKRYVDRVEDMTRVTVYSNLPEVELLANGIRLGRQKSDEHFFYFLVPNVGETTLTAVAGEYSDVSEIRKVDTFNEAYRLREKGAVLNWFDITEPEGYYSLNDTVKDVLRSEEGKSLFHAMMQEAVSGIGDANAMLKPENMGSMMQMMEGFTVLRLAKLMGAANVTITKEQLLGLNAQLNKIKKVKR